MTDLRKAAELALEALEDVFDLKNKDVEAIQALRQALAQTEKPPETAKRKHEPFIYVREDNEKPFGGFEHCSEADAGAFPVYTAPPKREWVGLTEEEMSALKQKSVDDGMTRLVSDFEYIRSIEAKLKEKNT